jgi:hypothetical protein
LGLYCDIIRLNDEDIIKCLSISDKQEELYRFIQNTDPDNWFELDKAWHGIHFLLTKSIDDPKAAFLLTGGKILRDYNWQENYGIDVSDMRAFLSAETVKVNQVLCKSNLKDLKRSYDPGSLFKNNIYPGIWEKRKYYTSRFIAKYFKVSRSLDYLIYNFEKLQSFISETSEHNKGIIIKYHQ